MLSPEVLAFLRDMLARQRLDVGAPDFPAAAAMCAKAIAELDAALNPASAVTL